MKRLARKPGLGAFLVGLAFAPLVAAAAKVDEVPMGETVERHLSTDTPYMQWVTDPDGVATNMEDQIVLRDPSTGTPLSR